MTSHQHPYIVLEPNMRANPVPQHAVVHVDEWVELLLDEKDSYDYITVHEDYVSAAQERDRINHLPTTGVRLERQATDTPTDTEEEQWEPQEPEQSPVAVHPLPAPAEPHSAPQTSPAPSGEPPIAHSVHAAPSS